MALDMDQRMFFVIGAPRSGTTMLMRMLHAHPDIYTRPEPHLLTPLAHLGYYGYAEKASYDPFQAHQAAREYVGDLPNREADYVDALRAYCDILYGRMLEPSGKRFFVDKTPAYALVLPFVKKVYPNARYVVLTRHPFAIFSSYAKSFFDDDWAAAQKFNPILERYVPALAAFVREHAGTGGCYHVRYEQLVAEPETTSRELCAYAGMTFTPEMIDYGSKKMEVGGLGDPIGVDKDTRPNTKSIDKWANGVAGNQARIDLLQGILARLDDADLATFGYTRESVWDALKEVSPAEGERAKRTAKKWDRYALERRVLLTLRRNIRENMLGRTLTRVRFYCDVLLRE